jgi:hypothetical protein
MAFNQAQIIASYQLKPKAFMCAWCAVSYWLFGFVFECYVVVNNTVLGIFDVDEEDIISAPPSAADNGGSTATIVSTNSNFKVSSRFSNPGNNFSRKQQFSGGVVNDETSMSHARFLFHSKLFSFVGSLFALYVLYMMVLKRAYFTSNEEQKVNSTKKKKSH